MGWRRGVVLAIVLLQLVKLIESAGPGQRWYYGRPFPGSMTQGGVWPLPWSIQYDTYNHTIAPSQFTFGSNYNCDILSDAFSRYKTSMFPGSASASENTGSLTSLQITITASCPSGYPQLEMDETCTPLSLLYPKICSNQHFPDQLTVLPNNSQATLTANEIWGALRGLETFSQLVFFPTLTTVSVRLSTLHLDVAIVYH